MLEERVSDHAHERMSMEALPGSSFEVIEPEFLLQLGLFANPSRLAELKGEHCLEKAGLSITCFPAWNAAV